MHALSTRPGSGRLTVDVDAVVANHRKVSEQLVSGRASAVVKADAYGLGADRIAPSLWRSGCRDFFVARLDEGIALRRIIPDVASSIHVLDGTTPGSEADFSHHELVPVANSLDQLARWQAQARRLDRMLPVMIHVDTGMRRLGLDGVEFAALVDRPDLLVGLTVTAVASHLACADDPDSDDPEHQLERFRHVRRALPMGQASLANSAAVFRHPDFHFDLVRPGYALYGGHPAPGQGDNPMNPVVTLEVPVLQVRSEPAGGSVGYGASHVLERPSRLATVGLGYADGFLRSGSNRGWLRHGDVPVPIIGRVSMDLVTVDVTDVPPGSVSDTSWLEVIGQHRRIDHVADDAGTIGYEILTSLGTRFQRRYVGSFDDRD